MQGVLKLPSFGGPTGKRYINFALMCAFFSPRSRVRGFILSSLTSGPSDCETTAACRQTSLAARLFNHSRAVVMCAECGLALSCLKKKSSHFAEMLLPNLFYRSALMAPSQMCRLPRMPCRSKPLHIIQSAVFFLNTEIGFYWFQCVPGSSPQLPDIKVRSIATLLPSVRLQLQSPENNWTLDK